jgi:hypothetical protein
MSGLVVAWLVRTLSRDNRSMLREGLTVISRLDAHRIPTSVRHALLSITHTDLGKMPMSAARLYIVTCLRLDISIHGMPPFDYCITLIMNGLEATTVLRRIAVTALHHIGRLDEALARPPVRSAMGHPDHAFLYRQVVALGCPSVIETFTPTLLEEISGGSVHTILTVLRHLPSASPFLPAAIDAARHGWETDPSVDRLILLTRMCTLATAPLLVDWGTIQTLAAGMNYPLLLADALVQYILDTRPTETPPPEWVDVVFHTSVTFGVTRHIRPGIDYTPIMDALMQYACLHSTTLHLGGALLRVMATGRPEHATTCLRRCGVDMSTLLMVLHRAMPEAVVESFAEEVSAALFTLGPAHALAALNVLQDRSVALAHPSTINVRAFTRTVMTYVYGTPSRVVSILHRSMPVFAMEIVRCMCSDPADLQAVGFALKIVTIILQHDPDAPVEVPDVVLQLMPVVFGSYWYVNGDRVTANGKQARIVRGLANGTYMIKDLATRQTTWVGFLDLTPPSTHLRTSFQKRWILQSWDDLIRRTGACPVGCQEAVLHIARFPGSFESIRYDTVDILTSMYRAGLITPLALTRVLTPREMVTLAQTIPRRTSGPDALDAAMMTTLAHEGEARSVMASRRHSHPVLGAWLIEHMVESRYTGSMVSVHPKMKRTRLWIELAGFLRRRSVEGRDPLSVPEAIAFLRLVLVARGLTNDGAPPVTIPRPEAPFFEELSLMILASPDMNMSAKRMLVTLYTANPHLVTDRVVHGLLPFLEMYRIGMIEFMAAIVTAPVDRHIQAFFGIVKSRTGVKRTRSAISDLRSDISRYISRDVGVELGEMMGIVGVGPR